LLRDYRKIFQTSRRMVGAVRRANSVRARIPSDAELTKVFPWVMFPRGPHVPHPV
jgi:hypothetical protein